MALLFLTLVSLFSFMPALAKQELCSTVVLHGKNEIEFTAVEKRMVCGDPQLPAYKIIPSYQAALFMTGFLQSRGFLNPEFETIEEVLHVKTGRKSELKLLEVSHDNNKESKIVKDELTRRFEKRMLNPQLLNRLEGEGLHLLRRRGFPCAKVDSQANALDDSVNLSLHRLHHLPFGEIDKEAITGLHDNALDRYYPFRAHDPFDERLLILTEKRMRRDEVVQGTYFLENCSEDGTEFSLAQEFLVGPPRTFRFGFGASTEEGPMARARWSNNRYESMASRLSINMQASFRSQSFTISADQFFWKNNPRQSLLSTLEVVREDQFDYEQLVQRMSPHMKWTHDSRSHFWRYTFGPAFETGTFHFRENNSTRSFATGVIQGSLLGMEHDYEYFDIHPEEGNQLALNMEFRHPAMGFTDSLLKLDTSVVQLTRIGFWDRGNLIAGARLNAGTTWVPDDVSLFSLPPTVKFYGGGSDDVRGFLLRTLPRNNGLGALTKLGMKLELRRTYLWRESLEGFIFTDGAYFGERSWYVRPRLWYTPGMGIRWLSPIGMVQTYWARAYATSPFLDDGNFFFIGLGGTF
jgi:translocation and assembly module TamA